MPTGRWVEVANHVELSKLVNKHRNSDAIAVHQQRGTHCPVRAGRSCPDGVDRTPGLSPGKPYYRESAPRRPGSCAAVITGPVAGLRSA